MHRCKECNLVRPVSVSSSLRPHVAHICQTGAPPMTVEVEDPGWPTTTIYYLSIIIQP